MKKRITQFSFEAIVLTALTAVTTLTFGVLINAMSSIHAIRPPMPMTRDQDSNCSMDMMRRFRSKNGAHDIR